MSMRDTRSSPARDDGGELRMGLSHCSGRNIWMVIYTMVLEVITRCYDSRFVPRQSTHA